ncbi:bifunctional diguanylate cyclase/phosphodiesterase [Bosea sp. 117]|uniref:bifunctional diguanylate cyclase/phosphodiesterase n=1 Tax=Bosea sp. 117 TaxID=1125973 RepID=UPI00068CDA7B|nr:bifunctional diguanylate cyclase/phosphodiesterase [Bosea sp. 117]
MTVTRLPDSTPAEGAQLSAARLARIVAGIGGTAYEWTIEDDGLVWDAEAGAVLGLSDVSGIATGKGYAALVDGASGKSRYDAIMDGGRQEDERQDDGRGVIFETVYRLRRDEDPSTAIWIEDRGVWFADETGKPSRACGIVRVLSEQEAMRREAERTGKVDPLMRPINRQHLAQAIEERLADAVRYRSQFGFLLINIDHLGRLNDAYGFEVTDEVIEMVLQRLRARMRGHDEIGRFSGNKFGIVLRDCSPDDMAVAAQRFISAIEGDALQTRGGSLAVAVTAGGVIAPRHARTVPEIFARAQDALERAKVHARGGYLPYQPSPEREISRRNNLRLTDEIVSALSEQRVTLAFQPIADAATRKVRLYECLVRIYATDGTVMDGGAIVPIAEKFGLMRLLDCRVLELALDALEADPDIRLSVNVSPSTVNDRSWLAALERRGRRGLASRLLVEITETAAINDVEVTRRFVHRLHDVGCKVAMDDFGAGYTSFRNLRRLGVDMLKLDGSFISPLMESEDDRFFVRTLLSLARFMGLATVAEWVPDEKTAALLVEWGCDYLQGEAIGLARDTPTVARMPSSEKV